MLLLSLSLGGGGSVLFHFVSIPLSLFEIRRSIAREYFPVDISDPLGDSVYCSLTVGPCPGLVNFLGESVDRIIHTPRWSHPIIGSSLGTPHGGDLFKIYFEYRYPFEHLEGILSASS